MAGTLKFHSTCSFRLGLPAKLRPSETVGTCFLVMYGKEPHALIAGLSTPPQPFWLKVHTALVHSCNSVICPWLDAAKMCPMQTDRHRMLHAETVRELLPSQARGSVSSRCAQPEIHSERLRGEQTQGVFHKVMARGGCPAETLLRRCAMPSLWLVHEHESEPLPQPHRDRPATFGLEPRDGPQRSPRP